MTKLLTLLGPHPRCAPLRSGTLRPAGFELEFAKESAVPHEAFKPFVRDLAFDCGELAIATFLQAKVYGKQLALLPVVISSRFHHGSISYNSDAGPLTPKDLEGRAVATRTYAQTTGVWVRGILKHEYGLDHDKVRWMTTDDSHLAEYKDPPNAVRIDNTKQPDELLRAGDVAAAMPISLASTALSGPPFKTLIPDPAAAAKAWYARYKTAPINHMLVVRQSVLDANPGAASALVEAFRESKKQTAPPADSDVDMLPIGIEEVRKALEIVIEFCHEQHLIPRRFEVDELFAGLRL